MRGHEFLALGNIIQSVTSSTDVVVATKDVTFVFYRRQARYVSQRVVETFLGHCLDVNMTLIFNHRYAVAFADSYEADEVFFKALKNAVINTKFWHPPDMDEASHYLVADFFPSSLAMRALPEELHRIYFVRGNVVIFPVRRLLEFDAQGRPVYQLLPSEILAGQAQKVAVPIQAQIQAQEVAKAESEDTHVS